jgi:hypothetical protein
MALLASSLAPAQLFFFFFVGLGFELNFALAEHFPLHEILIILVVFSVLFIFGSTAV